MCQYSTRKQKRQFRCMRKHPQWICHCASSNQNVHSIWCTVCMTAACETCTAMRPTHLYITWNIALQRLLNVPYRCHTRFLPHLTVTCHLKHAFKVLIKSVCSLVQSNIEIRNLCSYVLDDKRSQGGLCIARICNEYGVVRSELGMHENYWEVRWTLTLSNSYLWKMSTGKFSSALNLWTVSTVYHFVV